MSRVRFGDLKLGDQFLLHGLPCFKSPPVGHEGRFQSNAFSAKGGLHLFEDDEGVETMDDGPESQGEPSPADPVLERLDKIVGILGRIEDHQAWSAS
jgi:hypothetical protein